MAVKLTPGEGWTPRPAARTGEVDLSKLVALVDALKASIKPWPKYSTPEDEAVEIIGWRGLVSELVATIAQLKPITPREAGMIAAQTECEACGGKVRDTFDGLALCLRHLQISVRNATHVIPTRGAALADDTAEGVKK